MEPSDLHPDDLIGVIKVGGVSRLYAGVVAEWIMNYEDYDPVYAEREDVSGFRCGLLKVDSESAEQYVEAMQPYQLKLQALKSFLRSVGPRQWPLSMYVDFDAKLQISAFGEVPVCEYVAKGWRCSYDNPMDYVSEEVASLWSV